MNTLELANKIYKDFGRKDVDRMGNAATITEALGLSTDEVQDALNLLDQMGRINVKTIADAKILFFLFR